MKKKHYEYYLANKEKMKLQQKERRDRDNKEINEKRRENYINKKDEINKKRREIYHKIKNEEKENEAM